MPAPRDIEAVAEILYGIVRDDVEVPLQAVLDSCPNMERAQVEDVLGRMGNEGLVQIPFGRNAVRLVASGKLAHSRGCISEILLGEQFIDAKYRTCVVHVIVRNQRQEESGGTGFFVAEPENLIVTAKHLFDNHSLHRVEDLNGRLIVDGAARVRLAPGELDLAIIEAAMPIGVTPLRIEWQDDLVQELDRVLILGFPPYAGHHVALHRAPANIVSKPLMLREPGKHSLMIPRIAAAGCSGGPVIDARGFVVGVVSRDNIFQRLAANEANEGGGHEGGRILRNELESVIYISATPAAYLRPFALIRAD